MKNKFIVLEGIDGSGKTTTCKKLCEILKCNFFSTPPYPYSDVRDMIDKKVNLKARYLFYLSSVLHASEEIRKLLKQNHVVCDRYILSTLCYHRAANQNLNFIDENQLDILQPDFTFFLKASYKIRMSRIVEREKIDLEKAMNDYLHNETFQKKVENEYFKYDNLITVDSSELSAAEVANKINTDFLAS